MILDQIATTSIMNATKENLYTAMKPLKCHTQ